MRKFVCQAIAIDHNLSNKRSRGAGLLRCGYARFFWNELVAQSHGGGDSVTVREDLTSWEQAGCAFQCEAARSFWGSRFVALAMPVQKIHLLRQEVLFAITTLMDLQK